MSPVFYTVPVVAFDPTDANALGLADLAAINTQTGQMLFDAFTYLKVDPQTPA